MHCETVIFWFEKIEVNTKLIDILVNTNICSSRREAREFLTNNAISLNGEKVSEENQIITKDDALFNKYLIFRKGKKNYYARSI